MAAFTWIKLCLKKFTLHSIQVSRGPNSLLLVAIVFWDETNSGDLCGSLCDKVIL